MKKPINLTLETDYIRRVKRIIKLTKSKYQSVSHFVDVQLLKGIETEEKGLHLK